MTLSDNSAAKSSNSGGTAFIEARDFLLNHREDYAAAYTGFQWPRLENFNWALDYFDTMARGNENSALWIVDESGNEDKFSFEDLARRSNQVANYLRAKGIGRGDRILIMLPNVAPLWEITLAAMKLGAVISPATTVLSAADLTDRVERGEMRMVITDRNGTESFADVPGDYQRLCIADAPTDWEDYGDAATNPDEFAPQGITQASDPLLIYFTSGTTSKPKMVLHSHQSYPVGHLSTMYWIGLREGDVHYNISSPGWAKHSWSSFFAPWNAGATIFIYNQSGRFDAGRTLSTIVDKGVTSLCAPPTAWRTLIQHDLASFPVKLRELVSAGEPLNPEVIEQVQNAWNLTIREGYGQTETTAMLACPPGTPVRPGSLGRPLPGYDIVLLDDDGKDTMEGEVSVILSPRPVGVMIGYANDAERTQQSLGGSHYGTSDVANRDDDGFYWFVGRTDDVFKSSDYRISPFELESVLIEHPAVAEAAVVESPDEKRLCVPKACVALASGHEPSARTAKSIFDFVRERVAPFKRIRIVEFCELPKTVSGKIRRNELRRAEATRCANDTRGPGLFLESD